MRATCGCGGCPASVTPSATYHRCGSVDVNLWYCGPAFVWTVVQACISWQGAVTPAIYRFRRCCGAQISARRRIMPDHASRHRHGVPRPWRGSCHGMTRSIPAAIEHLRDMLQRHVVRRQNPPQTVQTLTEAPRDRTPSTRCRFADWSEEHVRSDDVGSVFSLGVVIYCTSYRAAFVRLQGYSGHSGQYWRHRDRVLWTV